MFSADGQDDARIRAVGDPDQDSRWDKVRDRILGRVALEGCHSRLGREGSTKAI
jgi:hypothetical protein